MPWLLWGSLFLIALFFQVRSGAWRSDFGGHADEGAHVVTSLMVRDYLGGGFIGQPHPMRYAEEYYARFPKVALGHYPPGFYLVAASILLPFRAGAALLLLMSAIAASAGMLVTWFGRRLGFGRVSAVLLAVTYLLLPQTRTYTSLVMADLLLVLFTLLAARSFLRFLDSGTTGDSILFGCWAAGAILTKGSAVGLAFLPPLAIFFSGKLSRFFVPRLWLAPVPVLVLALPWIWLTLGITREGMQGGDPASWASRSAPFYSSALIHETGWIALSALLSAIFLTIKRFWQMRCGERDEVAVLWALLLAGAVVPILVPTGFDHRYLMPLVPSILLLGAWGVSSLLGRRIRSTSGAWQQQLSVALFLILVLAETARPVWKFYTGASTSIDLILAAVEERGGDPRGVVRILVISDATGEGALVAAGALVGPKRLRMDRGSKFLARSDWMGRGYASAFKSPGELREQLVAGTFEFLVIDPPPPGAVEHWRSVHQWLQAGGLPEWQALADVPAWRRQSESRFRIYAIRSPDPAGAGGSALPAGPN